MEMPAASGVTVMHTITFNMGPDNLVESVDVSVESLHLVMECLLNGALNDYLKYREGSELFANARAWLFEEEGDDIMAFHTCCAVLGLQPDRVRFAVNAAKDRGKVRYLPKEFCRLLEACR